MARRRLARFLGTHPEWNPGLRNRLGAGPSDRACSLEGQASDGCPISGFEKGVPYRIYPGGNTTCLDGAPYYFQVIRGDSDKLLYYFQGGGACWDKLTFDMPGVCLHGPIDEGTRGILDAEDIRNPYRSYTKVVLMYCSGDIFAGSTVQKWGLLGRSVAQHGFHNAAAALTWTAAQFSSMSRLVLSGYSAGSLGVQWWSDRILRTFAPLDPVAAVVADSFAPVLFPPSHERRSETSLYMTWGGCDTGVLPEKLQQKCNNGTLLFQDVWLSAMQAHPRVRFANVNAKADEVQIAFERLLETSELNWDGALMTPEEYYQVLNGLLEYWSPQPNYASFVIDGDHHCYTDSHVMFTATPLGKSGFPLSFPKLIEWLDFFVASQNSLKHVCTGAREHVAPYPAKPINDTRYCDAALDATALRSPPARPPRAVASLLV